MSAYRNIGKILLIFAFAIAGGIISGQFSHSSTTVYNPDGKLREDGQAFFDRDGKKRVDIGLWHGSPIQDFYGEDRKLRLQFGTYAGDVRNDEAGLPVGTFYDNNSRLKLLLRLDRKNQAPLIILKDNTGTNRLIMGLALYDPDEDPFMLYLDKNGEKHMVFGQFMESTVSGSK